MTNSTEFPRGFPRKLEGVVGKRAGNTERKPGRVREETLVQAKSLVCVETFTLPYLTLPVLEPARTFSGKQKGKHRVPSTFDFAFPEISRETECLVLGILFLSSFPESESWMLVWL